MPRACLISDTHSFHRQIQLESVDILFVAGDFSLRRTEEELIDFLSWMREQHEGSIVLVSGNHDRYYWKNTPRFLALMNEYDICYLENSSVDLLGLKIWGSPITAPALTGLKRRFEMDESSRNEIWTTIPPDVDVVITHCPPFGILDSSEGFSLGCKSLLDRIFEIKPKYHLFGHIHQSYGRVALASTIFCNGALCGDVTYGIVNNAVYFEIETTF
jgi:Icc-related predicted phosphoesterase